MAGYIDREKVAELIDYHKEEYCEAESYFELLKEDFMQLPCADVQPVRYGKWMYCSIEGMFHCTRCDAAAVRNSFAYCPYCGAKMTDDLSDDEKLQADVLAKIETLIHEAEECPEWKAQQALRCLRKELMEKLGLGR